MGSAFATNERHTHTFTSRRVGALKLAEKRWVDHGKVADTNTDEASHKKKTRIKINVCIPSSLHFWIYGRVHDLHLTIFNRDILVCSITTEFSVGTTTNCITISSRSICKTTCLRKTVCLYSKHTATSDHNRDSSCPDGRTCSVFTFVIDPSGTSRCK